jgi:hypothetical protein
VECAKLYETKWTHKLNKKLNGKQISLFIFATSQQAVSATFIHNSAQSITFWKRKNFFLDNHFVQGNDIFVGRNWFRFYRQSWVLSGRKRFLGPGAKKDRYIGLQIVEKQAKSYEMTFADSSTCWLFIHEPQQSINMGE